MYRHSLRFSAESRREQRLHTYQVNVTRDGRWWMIAVPELHRHVTASGAINSSTVTQARRIAEAASQARDFICTVTDAQPSEVAMNITICVDER